jgi:hypothetical protein
MKIALFLLIWGYDSSIPILTSEQIDVEGTWSAPEEEDDRSPEEIIQDAQRKAEIKNVKRLAKDIENMKVDRSQTKAITDKEKAKLSNKIKNVFSSATGENYDAPSTAPAVTPPPPPAPAPTPAPPASSSEYFTFTNLRLVPSLQFFNWPNVENMKKRYKYGFGLALETTEERNYAAGVNLNYIRGDIESFGNIYQSNTTYNYNYAYIWGQFGLREIDFGILQLQLRGRYFFSPQKKFKFFVLAKFGFNYLKLAYKDSRGTTQGSYYFGGEDYTNAFIDAQVGLGSELSLNKALGVSVDLSAGHRLFSLTDDNARPYYSYPDQDVLSNIAKKLYKSTSINLGFGLYWYF